MSITLEIPSLAHKKACEEMIAEWMRFGGEIHPGLLRRYSERPSERRKGYAVQMLWLALPLLRGKGVCTAVITCDRNNLASASTILRCKGIEAGEILDPDTGGINRIFKICLSDG